MKLYYMPGTCSLAPMIALAEAGIEATLVKVGRDKKTADGRDYLAINPYGYVPALELDDGRVLTEGPAILQYLADLRPVVGSEQGGVRPVLIIQHDIGNRHSPTVICAAITSRMNKAKLPTHIEIEASAYGIVRDSVILLEQLRTIDKRRLKDKICHLTPEQLALVNEALKISLDLPT